MSEHISDRIAEFLDGHLGPAMRREFEEHIQACTECAADLAYVRDLRRRALEQGHIHVPAARLVDAVDGTLELDEHEELHLQACEDCRRERDWLVRESERSAPDGGSSAPEPRARIVSAPTGRRVRLRWAGGLTALAAVVAAVLVLRPSPDDSNRLAQLARIEPLPVRLVRSPASDDFEAARLSGLESYRDGAWLDARQEFSRALELRPGAAEMLLYRGSAALLAGDVNRALTDFSEVIESPDTGADLREEATWQRANALLREGRLEPAERLLRQLADGRGYRAEVASLLLGDLED